MSLAPGTRIGSYEILALIGVGGMGEVYRAQDTRLRRHVAIKILPALVAGDADRLARFEREAQTLAALNHPHIASVYGLEATGPTQALVMELVEGPTLADRVAGGPVPVTEALTYARQIADALEAAHERHIIHRDLKPANIKLTADGQVKVLDFGLAKALAPDGASATADGAANSPTLTNRATQMGMILGTAAYMAPEQARGKPVDRRADVWGFGCVLYELVTGRRAFEGEDITAVLARVIEREPNWDALPAATPPALRRLLARCLIKEPKARLRDIGEARIAIDEILGGKDTGTSSPATPIPQMVLHERPPTPWLPWTLAALLGAVAIAAFAWPRDALTPVTDSRLTRVELSLPPDVEFFSSPRVSDDGGRVAFVGVREGTRQVYVRDLNQSETRAIAGTDGANMVTFSPSGDAAVVLMTDGRVRRLTLQTGALDDLATGDILGGVAWGSDGTIYYGDESRLMAVPSGGGAARAIATLDKAGGETSLIWPMPTRNGRTVLFTSWRQTGNALRSRIEAVPAAGGARRVVLEDTQYVMATALDRLVFQRDNTLFVAPFDANRAEVTGAPIRVSEQAHVNPNGGPAADLAGTGAFVFAPNRIFHGRLVWVSMDGIERVIDAPARGYQNVRVSPDGKTVAFSELGAVWTLDLTRGALTRVFLGMNGLTGFPVWSADGTELIFRTGDGVYTKRADGEGPPRRIEGTTRLDYPSSASPDGATLMMLRIASESGGDLLLQPMKGGQPRVVVQTKAYEGGPMVSPDGKWLAYVSNESGRMEVYLRPVEGPDRKWPVSSGGGLHPLWSRDGRQVYFRSGQQMRVVDVQTSPDVRLSTPRTLFERRYSFGPNLTVPNYSISRDGKDLLLVREESGSGHLSLVFNWLQNVGR